MRVAIAGGHGKIGIRLTRMLAAGGNQVASLIRNPEHADDVRNAGGDPVVCDLEADDPEAIAAAIKGSDAVVFAAGAGPGSGPERKQTMDYGGAVKLIEAAKNTGASRYLMVSSIGADADASGNDFAIYQSAKGRADEELRKSGLDFTIVRPGRLTDDPGSGKVEAGESVGGGEISRGDVAAVLLACFEVESTVGKTFELISGDVPIDEAIAAL